MDIDDSFENNNNIFKLDFENILKDDDKNFKMGDACFYGDICNDNHYHNFCRLNSNLSGLNHDNGFMLSRQNSFSSLPFNG